MIVPLTLSSGPTAGARTLPPALARLGSSELFLLELQGDLEVSGDKRGQLVGHLTIDDSGKGKPTLRIGYHLLEGTIVSLAKPLAVLQRVPTPSRSQIPPPPQPDEDISMHCADDGDEELGAPGTASTAAAATSYTIRTLVRKKIVFSKRPTPIVGASAKIGVPL
ncbi:Ctf8-domain-containing protein [Lactarius hatsudake]|nr:Ctf8-domain-containing protein [Lactarius hatsudake]